MSRESMSMSGDTMPPRAPYRTSSAADDAPQSTLPQAPPRYPNGGVQPAQELLLKRRVLSIAEYALELQQHQGKGPLSHAERIALYGSTMVPVSVPLAPGESEEQYEQGFLAMLQRRGFDLERLRDDPNKERSLRISYSFTKVNEHNRQRRERFKEEVMNESERDVKRAKLTAKRYVDLGQFKRDVRNGLFAKAKQMSKAEKLQAFGTTIVPVHVPLAYGETKEQYEDRFVAWLQDKQQRTLEQVQEDRDVFKERYYRVLFASLHVSGEERFVPRERKRGRSPHTDPDDDRPAKRKMAGNLPAFTQEPPRRNREVIFDTAADTATDMATDPQSEVTASSASSVPCPSESPLPGTPTADAIVEAYTACGCKRCLLHGMQQLASRVSAIERDCKCRGSLSLVADLTLDDDAHSSSSLTVTKLVLSKPTAAELHRQAQLTSSPIADIVEDAVEKKLLGEYDEVNECIVVNEQVLEASATELAATPITDIDETTRLQDENHELRELVQGEVDKRNAALVVLIVYVWRHDPSELKRMIHDATACDVLHVQRMNHHKCGQLSTVIKQKRLQIETIKADLDRALGSTGDSLTLVAELGRQLTETEQELAGLVRERRQAFTMLIHFDQRVRLLIQTLLARTEQS